MNLDNNLLKWIQKQIDLMEFNSKSSGVRKCIRIAKRVYEQGTPDEKVKFIFGVEK